jgi:hypothetical protein
LLATTNRQLRNDIIHILVGYKVGTTTRWYPIVRIGMSRARIISLARRIRMDVYGMYRNCTRSGECCINYSLVSQDGVNNHIVIYPDQPEQTLLAYISYEQDEYSCYSS